LEQCEDDDDDQGGYEQAERGFGLPIGCDLVIRRARRFALRGVIFGTTLLLIGSTRPSPTSS
jgi:hypothetical protein